MLFPSLDKRNTRDKAKGLHITSEGHIGELGVRCLSTLNREQDSRQQSLYGFMPLPSSRRAVPLGIPYIIVLLWETKLTVYEEQVQ